MSRLGRGTPDDGRRHRLRRLRPGHGRFLTTLSRQLVNPDGTPAVESPAMPGLPLQVLCYERADDIGFGVSGVVTRARGIRASFPDLDPSQIPMAAPVKQEKVVVSARPASAPAGGPAPCTSATA